MQRRYQPSQVMHACFDAASSRNGELPPLPSASTGVQNSRRPSRCLITCAASRLLGVANSCSGPLDLRRRALEAGLGVPPKAQGWHCQHRERLTREQRTMYRRVRPHCRIDSERLQAGHSGRQTGREQHEELLHEQARWTTGPKARSPPEIEAVHISRKRRADGSLLRRVRLVQQARTSLLRAARKTQCDRNAAPVPWCAAGDDGPEASPFEWSSSVRPHTPSCRQLARHGAAAAAAAAGLRRRRGAHAERFEGRHVVRCSPSKRHAHQQEHTGCCAQHVCGPRAGRCAVAWHGNVNEIAAPPAPVTPG